jgi:DNA-binding NtrC family response regulator
VLAARYLALLAGRHGLPLCTLSATAIEVLQRYAWPGNVRELENVLERAVMFSSSEEIEPDALTGIMAAPEAGGGLATPTAAIQAVGQASQLVRAATEGILSPTTLPGVFRVEPLVQGKAASAAPAAPAAEGEAASASGWLTLADVERIHLERTLAATMQNKSLAAKLLGIDRSVLRRKLQRYGLAGTDPAATDDPAADDGGTEPT